MEVLVFVEVTVVLLFDVVVVVVCIRLYSHSVGRKPACTHALTRSSKNAML